MKHFNIHIYGKVQGVSFRFEAITKARANNIKGFVKNLPDGSVYIEAEGKEDSLNDFLKWCHQGPLMANVSNVEKEEAKLKNFSEFEVEF